MLQDCCLGTVACSHASWAPGRPLGDAAADVNLPAICCILRGRRAIASMARWAAVGLPWQGLVLRGSCRVAGRHALWCGLP